MSVPRGTKYGERHFSLPPKQAGLEFFQKIVIVAFIVSVVMVAVPIGLNFVLLWNGKQPMQQETVATITTFGGIMAGAASFAYAGLNAIRAWSLNKHVTGPSQQNGGDNHED